MSDSDLHGSGTRRRIVVGIDGSERSADAIALARRLAIPSRATVVVANVCPIDLYVPTSLLTHDEAWARLDTVRPALSGIDDWEPRVVDASSPARGLHDLAEREHADLIVIGSTHRGPVARRVVLGRVARRLLHGSPCAVAIAPNGFGAASAGSTLVVGVAFDGSPESRQALAAGARWARDLGARLRLVTALPLPSPANPMFGTVSYRHTIEAMRRFGHDRLERARAEVDVPDGVVAELREGDPVSVLVDESTRLDLLLVGSRTYGPVRTVLLGGVSGPVAERAGCPVIVLPRGATSDTAAQDAGSPAAGPLAVV
jgi:nucleotide-binding universal stress UspA family protein